MGNLLAMEEKDFPQRSWNHICWLFDNGMNQVYINTHLFDIIQNPEQKGRFAFQSSNNVYSSAFIIGQEQDMIGGAFSEKQIYQGYSTEMNIWDYVLEHKDVVDMGKCETSWG